MTKELRINRDYLDINSDLFEQYLTRAAAAQQQLYDGSGLGNDYIGWVEWVNTVDQSLVVDILETARNIKASASVLLVIGIGGSYLGAKSTLEALLPHFDNEQKIKSGKGLRVYFLGHHMSQQYIATLLKHIADEEIFVNVISKSGTTTEPAVAFRLVRQFMQDKYGSAYPNRIIATTDCSRGALKAYADSNGIKSYVIPDNIGGRYSLFTPVGLLPLAALDIDIADLLAGAKSAYTDFKMFRGVENAANVYAALRNYFYDAGYKVEILANYNPQLSYLAEWWKQLYGESEGKGGKGILPHAMNFTTDLHSLGQYVQDGERLLFETVLDVVEPGEQIAFSDDDDDMDGLNYLAGKPISEINRTAMLGTILAHSEGGVPNIVIELAELDAHHLGYLYYFFMLSCGISGYMLAVNPFDQPGVENYKNNMFALLGKSGYEDLAAQLNQKIDKLR